MDANRENPATTSQDTRTLGEMTPVERTAIVQRAAAQFQAEMDATADQISTALSMPDVPPGVDPADVWDLESGTRDLPGDEYLTPDEIRDGETGPIDGRSPEACDHTASEPAVQPAPLCTYSGRWVKPQNRRRATYNQTVQRPCPGCGTVLYARTDGNGWARFPDHSTSADDGYQSLDQ